MSDLPKIPIIASVGALAARYDAWLCDVWGVMHNGVSAYAGAVDACRRFRAGGGTVLLLSNAPRPGSAVLGQLGQCGVPDDAFDALVTSGDVARSLLKRRPGGPVFHLGPERDRPLFEGLDICFAGPEEAELAVCSGLYDDTAETPEDYAELLGRLKTRELEMICANPDIKVERGDRLVYCAGAIAQAYEALGGRAVYTGKPHGAIYDLAFERLAELRGKPVARTRALAIGDGVKTDIAGAAAAGLDALFVASGLHLGSVNARESIAADEVGALFMDAPAQPVAAQARLAW